MTDDDREWSDYEEGAIHALMDVAWHRTDIEVTDFKGAVTRFDNWRELVEEANARWYEEFEQSIDEESGEQP